MNLASLICLRMTHLSSPHVGSCNFSHSIFSNLTSLLLPNILGNPYILIIYDSCCKIYDREEESNELHVITIIVIGIAS